MQEKNKIYKNICKDRNNVQLLKKPQILAYIDFIDFIYSTTI